MTKGDGFYSDIKDRLSGFHHGRRLDWPPKDRTLLIQYGEFYITQITLGRASIHEMLDKALQLLSLGTWNDLKKQYNYHRMYHLHMLIQLSNNNIVRVEKNAVVSISNTFKIENDAEFYHVAVSTQCTLNPFFNKTIETIGLKQFFVYSPFSENCHRFLLDILGCNGLLSEQAKQFIYQDISELSKQLPQITKCIGQTLTDTAHRADVLLNA